MAKFEVCCHKWADLSDQDYGVSILNDSKYGFATSGNLMRLSLLRAPKAPDAHADMGRHHIRYAILPHSGPLGPTTVLTAFNFNNPMTLHSIFGSDTGAPHKVFKSSCIEVTGSKSLIVDTIKRGEDDEDVSRGEFSKRTGRSVILRVYESLGGHQRGTIRTTFPVKKAWKCNILEDDEEELRVREGTMAGKGGKGMMVDIELRNFEVATFRLQL